MTSLKTLSRRHDFHSNLQHPAQPPRRPPAPRRSKVPREPARMVDKNAGRNRTGTEVTSDEFERRLKRALFVMRQDTGNDMIRPEHWMRILEGRDPKETETK